MCNSTDILDFKTQEYFGWTGNVIFLTAQIFQIIHTFKKKKTDDISYGLQICWILGNIMYTVFGILDKSLSIFIGNFLTLLTSVIQIIQKIVYDRRNSNSYKGLYIQIK